MDSLFTPWRTPAGLRFLLAAPPWSRNTLLLWDEARSVWDWPSALAVLSPAEAWAYLDAAEDAHGRHGFHILPDWRGLRIPASCPAGVVLDLQACFLALSYGEGGVR